MVPPIDESNPFQGATWQKAAEYMQSGHAPSAEQIRAVATTALADGKLTSGENDLIGMLLDKDVSTDLAKAVSQSHAPFQVSYGDLFYDKDEIHDMVEYGPADAKRDQVIAGVTLGQGNAYDELQVPVQRLDAMTQNIGPGTPFDLATPAGIDATLGVLAQNAQATDMGATSCGPTSLTAIATHAGYDGVKALAEAYLADRGATPGSDPHYHTIQAMITDLEGHPPSCSLEQLGQLAAALYDHLNRIDSSPGTGLTAGCLGDFLQRQEDTLAPLFAKGERILFIDTDGDRAVNHFVAEFPDEDRVFDPWDMQGGHLAEGRQAQVYRVATQWTVDMDGVHATK